MPPPLSPPAQPASEPCSAGPLKVSMGWALLVSVMKWVGQRGKAWSIMVRWQQWEGPAQRGMSWAELEPLKAELGWNRMRLMKWTEGSVCRRPRRLTEGMTRDQKTPRGYLQEQRLKITLMYRTLCWQVISRLELGLTINNNFYCQLI